MNNIYLVQVVDSYGPNKFLPLAISYQWLYAKNSPQVAASWQVAGVLIEKLNIKQYVDTMKNPTVVAMSCYIWNWNYNCELAQQIKKKWPDCVIIIGGPQVSKTDFLLLKKHPYFDVAILGENELGFRLILENFESRQFAEIPGIMLPGRITSAPNRTFKLDELPSPILSGFYDTIMNQYCDPNIMWQVTFETMRGCPYHCAFCDIGDDYWNKVSMIDQQRILDEITWMSEKRIEYVSVCDSNWGLFERDVAITQHVVDCKLVSGYPKFWDVSWAKNNTERVKRIAMIDRQANTKLFKGITFAVQSFNQPTLDSVDRFNLNSEKVSSSMNFFAENDISTYSEMIWPLPNETVDTLTQGLQQLLDLNQRDFVMVHPLVLTPNSPLGQPDQVVKHGLKYLPVPLDTFWLKITDPDYVTEQVYAVCETSAASFDQMIQGHLQAYWLIVLYYYGWSNMIMNYVKSCHAINETEFIKQLMTFIQQHPNSLLAQEHYSTEKNIRAVFESGEYWGRKIDDVYWEYKSATSVVFNRCRSQVTQELEQFLQTIISVPDSLMELNAMMCFDWQQSYPKIISVDPKVAMHTLGINASKLQLDHWDKSITTESEFNRVAYHYQRKNRYWRCTVSAAE